MDADLCCFRAEIETQVAGVPCVCVWLCAFADGHPVCTECEFRSEVLDRCTKTISRLLQGISRVIVPG